MKNSEWQSFDLEALRARLVEIKDLLEQAVVVGAAEDTARVEAMSKLAEKSRENASGPPGRRRRYR